MKNLFRNTCFIIVTLIISQSFAQETAFHTENEHFNTGMRHIDEQKYLAAQEEFELLALETRQATDNEERTLHMYAEYYYAYSSFKLGLANTEVLYLDFIEKYHETPLRRKAYFDLGSYYFEKKNTSKAIEWYEQVETNDLSNDEIVTYKFNMSYAYFKKKKFDEARPLFRDIKNTKHKYYEPANYYYGFISFYEESYSEAENSFELLKDSELYKKTVPYYLTQIYFLRKDYDKVIDYATPLLTDKKIESQKEIAHILGQAHFEQENYSEAAPLLKAYIDNTKKVSKEEIYQLAYSQYKTEDYTNAIDNLLELNVVESDSLGQNAMYVLGDCYLKNDEKELARDAFFSASATDHDEFVQEMASFQYAKLSYELDYMNIAINSLTDYLEKYPNSTHANEAGSLLSSALLETKNYAKAIEILEQYNVSGPSVKKTYQSITLFRAIELYNDHQYDEALAMLNKSIKQPIDNNLHGLSIFLKGHIFHEKESYDIAVQFFTQFLQFDITDNSMVEWATPSLANYYMAYAYFKQQKYAQSSTYFEQTINLLPQNKTVKEQTIYQDALLRNADCLLMIKNYSKALSYYDQTIDAGGNHIEYALLQKAVIYGLQNQHTNKITTLQKLVNNHPNSKYIDFARFEMGNTYIQSNQPQKAIAQYNDLIKVHKNSPYIPEAWLKLGLTYFNIGNENQALSSYKKVVQDYPNSEEAKEALIALEDLYIYMGRPSDYIDFVENQTDITISVSKQDSLMFQVAEEQYMQANCTQATAALNEYLDLFPKGHFSLLAFYYRADCLYKAEQYITAYSDYKKVIEKGYSKHYETSLVKATYIAYEIKKDFQEANYLYNDLYNSASINSNKEIALIGLMRTYFKLNSHNEVLTYANQILDDSEINEEVKIEAKFYKAKSLFETQKYYQAETTFTELVSLIEISKIKAEAAYHIALIQYLNGQYQVSMDNCFNIKNEYASYQYWVVKTFILIADNYVALDNLFQAKATLQSIVDNYTGDQDLINEANEKLNTIIAQEQNETRIELNTEEPDTIQFDE